MGGIFSSPPNQKIAPTDFDSSNIGRGVDMDANMGDKEVKIKSLPASKYTTESNVSQTDTKATPNTSDNTKSEDKEGDGREAEEDLEKAERLRGAGPARGVGRRGRSGSRHS